MTNQMKQDPSCTTCAFEALTEDNDMCKSCDHDYSSYVEGEKVEYVRIEHIQGEPVKITRITEEIQRIKNFELKDFL